MIYLEERSRRQLLRISNEVFFLEQVRHGNLRLVGLNWNTVKSHVKGHSCSRIRLFVCFAVELIFTKLSKVREGGGKPKTENFLSHSEGFIT